LDEEQHQQAAGEFEKIQNGVTCNFSAILVMEFRTNIK